MKTLSTISAAVLAATFAIPAWAGPVGVGRTAAETQMSSAQSQPSPRLIAQLKDASEEALRNGRNGNKNNPVYLRKSAQIDDLIERLQSGQNVDPAEIGEALVPARIP
jgi:hypothetical protein